MLTPQPARPGVQDHPGDGADFLLKAVVVFVEQAIGLRLEGWLLKRHCAFDRELPHQPDPKLVGVGELIQLPVETALLAALEQVVVAAPFRRMVTPGGHVMSVAMTNCGTVGWVTDRRGYRYDPIDPDSGQRWPAMPDVFVELAQRAAAAAGFGEFAPDACLINCYEPGARLSLHQDKDERGYDAPIVSVSLGLPATFLFGGSRRTDRPRRVPLRHGDVVVWGGPARLAFHGVMPLADGEHPLLGRRRLNLTFRRAL